MIKTSYFRVASNLTNSVSIYKKTPPWFCMPIANELCADEELLKKFNKFKISEEEFIKIYVKEQLLFLDPYEILKKYDGKVFLGWANQKNFDCRLVIISWIKATTGIIIPELTTEEINYYNNNL